MTGRTLVVFTYRPIPKILAERGSQAWSLNAGNARRCTYIVCTRNRYFADAGPDEQAAAQEEHGAAFLVGRITIVEPSPLRADRHIVRFNEYAILDPQPVVWPGARNPVWYVDDIESLGIEPDTLNWVAMPDEAEADDAESDPHFEKLAGPLGHVILEFNGLEVDTGKMIAHLLREDEVTAGVFVSAMSLRGKLDLIRMLADAKVHDESLRQEFHGLVNDATKLNAQRNRFVHAEYVPVPDRDGGLARMLYRRLKDGGESADGSEGRAIKNKFEPIDERGLKTLAADIRQVASRTRALGRKYHDQRNRLDQFKWSA